MLSKQDTQDLAGSAGTVFGQDQERIGSLSAIYVSAETGEARWVSVNTRHEHTGAFIPLLEATARGADIDVPYTQAEVLAAPTIARDGHLDAEEERQLYRHYNLNHPGMPADRILPPAPHHSA